MNASGNITKGLLFDERYDEMFDAYCDLALDKNAQLGQESFIIRQIFRRCNYRHDQILPDYSER